MPMLPTLQQFLYASKSILHRARNRPVSHLKEQHFARKKEAVWIEQIDDVIHWIRAANKVEIINQSTCLLIWHLNLHFQPITCLFICVSEQPQPVIQIIVWHALLFNRWALWAFWIGAFVVSLCVPLTHEWFSSLVEEKNANVRPTTIDASKPFRSSKSATICFRRWYAWVRWVVKQWSL